MGAAAASCDRTQNHQRRSQAKTNHECEPSKFRTDIDPSKSASGRRFVLPRCGVGPPLWRVGHVAGLHARLDRARLTG